MGGPDGWEPTKPVKRGALACSWAALQLGEELEVDSVTRVVLRQPQRWGFPEEGEGVKASRNDSDW